MEKKKTVTSEVILKTVLNLGEQIAEVKATMATKGDLQRLEDKVSEEISKAKEDVLKEIRPVSKAVDKDAVTIVDHERRITKVETRLSIRR